MARRLPSWLLAPLGAMLLVYLLLPIGALILEGTRLSGGWKNPMVGQALSLSVFTTFWVLLISAGLGTPLAFQLAFSRSRCARVWESALQLPIVIPPSVAGLALLLTFGKHGWVGMWIGPLSFTTLAVVLAELFVASPLFVQGAISAFRQVDTRLLTVARTFGALPSRIFFQLCLPLAKGGLLRALALCGARALGEFGATLMFAGNLEGRTQTLPLAIYTALESDLSAAVAMSLILLGTAFLVLWILRHFARERSP